MDDGHGRPPGEEPEGPLPGWAVGLLAMQTIAVAIALVMPITPSKTGSTWSPADLFWEDPTYLEKVLASYVVVNILLVLLGLIAWVVLRRDESK